MADRHFIDLLRARWAQGKFVCVGLDSELARIPHSEMDATRRIFEFNKRIIKATADLVCAFKPNSAFYEAQGEAGLRVLRRTIQYIHIHHPEIPIILDVKRGDIGKTNLGYVAAALDDLRADAVTVNPYLGQEALRPFLDRGEKGIIVLCRTSNPGAGEFQDLLVDGEPLYLRVARNVAKQWNRRGNCALVVGATYPRELAAVREAAPGLPLLIPGIGTQGGDLEATVRAAQNNMIINSSSGIIFSDDPRAVTQTLHDNITRIRQETA